jgi:putative transposase
MRLPRPIIENCCIHVTHRCQESKFFFRTDVDRKYYQQLLFQASRNFSKVRILNYVITSNHIHILLWTPRMKYLSDMMHWLQGTFAQYYNFRKKREGSFWRGRFHPTLIESGEHLSQCLFYLDMNMVRAGVVSHPSEWQYGGYQELCGNRKRYHIIDQSRLLNTLFQDDILHFREWYNNTLNELCKQKELPTEKHWGSAFAVGSIDWFEKITMLPESVKQQYIEPVDNNENLDTYIINPPQSVLLKMWKMLKTK